MITTHTNRTFEQSVALTRPDRKAPVQGPRGSQEMLVLDGKVDSFMTDERRFPMQSLKELQALLKSETLADLKLRQAAGRGDDWMFHTNPHDRSDHSCILKVNSQSYDGIDLTWGTTQRATVKGNNATIKSVVWNSGSYDMTHTIHAEKNDKGNFVCTGESYHIREGYDGNLWGNAARIVND